MLMDDELCVFNPYEWFYTANTKCLYINNIFNAPSYQYENIISENVLVGADIAPNFQKG